MKNFFLAICMLATCTVCFSQSPFRQNVSSEDSVVEKSIIGYEICEMLSKQIEFSFPIAKHLKDEALTVSQRGSILYEMRKRGYHCVEGTYDGHLSNCEAVTGLSSQISFQNGLGERWLVTFERGDFWERVHVRYCKYQN